MGDSPQLARTLEISARDLADFGQIIFSPESNIIYHGSMSAFIDCVLGFNSDSQVHFSNRSRLDISVIIRVFDGVLNLKV